LRGLALEATGWAEMRARRAHDEARHQPRRVKVVLRNVIFDQPCTQPARVRVVVQPESSGEASPETPRQAPAAPDVPLALHVTSLSASTDSSPPPADRTPAPCPSPISTTPPERASPSPSDGSAASFASLASAVGVVDDFDAPIDALRARLSQIEAVLNATHARARRRLDELTAGRI
jgi:hypothetical protein